MAKYLCDIRVDGEPRMVPFWRALSEFERQHYRGIALAAILLGANPLKVP